MGQDSKIKWTHHTFNPWRGCTKVSEGCRNCYAETRAKRFKDGEWAPNGTRVIASEAQWKLPLKWNREAEAKGERHRVFCASLADVFEGDDTMPEASREAVREARVRLFKLIMETPHLDWLLLTKRPQNVLPELRNLIAFAGPSDMAAMLRDWLDGSPPTNVWLGASIQNQEQADKRIPQLLRVPADVRFLSVEPLLGDVKLDHVWLPSHIDPPIFSKRESGFHDHPNGGIHWVIVGGESGPNARPMHPDWARSLRDQCAAAGVPFFFKQWGEWVPPTNMPEGHWALTKPVVDLVGKGKLTTVEGEFMARVGKAKAGRLLDGREHNDMPRSWSSLGRRGDEPAHDS